jgi:hypothetical protein
MALSPKERERIIEEERLRFETRQALQAEACAKHPRRGRWLWLAALVLLGYAVWTWMACGGRACGHAGLACRYGHFGSMKGQPGMGWGGFHGGKSCHGAPEDDQEDVLPGQAIPEKKK